MKRRGFLASLFQAPVAAAIAAKAPEVVKAEIVEMIPTPPVELRIVERMVPNVSGFMGASGFYQPPGHGVIMTTCAVTAEFSDAPFGGTWDDLGDVPDEEFPDEEPESDEED